MSSPKDIRELFKALKGTPPFKRLEDSGKYIVHLSTYSPGGERKWQIHIIDKKDGSAVKSYPQTGHIPSKLFIFYVGGMLQGMQTITDSLCLIGEKMIEEEKKTT